MLLPGAEKWHNKGMGRKEPQASQPAVLSRLPLETAPSSAEVCEKMLPHMSARLLHVRKWGSGPATQ